ncbi:small vasohibin-binding protein isoform X2 [Marmota monax]|uniref:small vasohibin-binding protein isoform X2 n=1 Tax=Marmota monax TaxID=9995 RepID=UPI0026EA9D96|nr:small vasohibin-binding protein isoform X2 [Marmota monax]
MRGCSRGRGSPPLAAPPSRRGRPSPLAAGWTPRVWRKGRGKGILHVARVCDGVEAQSPRPGIGPACPLGLGVLTVTAPRWAQQLRLSDRCHWAFSADAHAVVLGGKPGKGRLSHFADRKLRLRVKRRIA